jgi:hypothetical protein
MSPDASRQPCPDLWARSINHLIACQVPVIEQMLDMHRPLAAVSSRRRAEAVGAPVRTQIQASDRALVHGPGRRPRWKDFRGA